MAVSAPSLWKIEKGNFFNCKALDVKNKATSVLVKMVKKLKNLTMVSKMLACLLATIKENCTTTANQTIIEANNSIYFFIDSSLSFSGLPNILKREG
jgi:hypothetical protein